MTDKTAYGGFSRSELLSSQIEHVDITSFDARPIIDSMAKMGFTSGDLARAASIYNDMLRDPDCTIFLVLAGSTSSSGCMDLYTTLVECNMVDGVVATGAAIVDMDFFEGLGFKHYRAAEPVDDETLRSLGIGRIYDTYIKEDELNECDLAIVDIASGLEPGPYSSRAFIAEMGQYLASHGTKLRTLVGSAFEQRVPVFCPAFSDCSAGVGLVMHQVEAISASKPYVTIDTVADFRELTEMVASAGTTGLVIVGGGSPKNFVQDAVSCARALGHSNVAMHKYAIQISVADVRDGACSSSTFQEATSWGKVSSKRQQMVFAEAGSVMPLLASDAYHRGHWRSRAQRRWATLFDPSTDRELSGPHGAKGMTHRKTPA